MAAKRTGRGTFEKGQSGNPGGRPVTKPLTTALLQALGEINKLTGEKAQRSAFERIAAVLITKAQNGDMEAIGIIFDRTEGKVVQALSHEGNPDRPVQGTIKVVHTFESTI